MKEKIFKLADKLNTTISLKEKYKIAKKIVNLVKDKDIYDREFLGREISYYYERKGLDRIATFTESIISGDYTVKHSPLNVCAPLIFNSHKSEEIEFLPFVMFNTRNHYERLIKELCKRCIGKLTIYYPEIEFADKYGNKQVNPEINEYTYRALLWGKNGYRDFSKVYDAVLCTDDISFVHKEFKKIMMENDFNHIYNKNKEYLNFNLEG